MDEDRPLALFFLRCFGCSCSASGFRRTARSASRTSYLVVVVSEMAERWPRDGREMAER